MRYPRLFVVLALTFPAVSLHAQTADGLQGSATYSGRIVTLSNGATTSAFTRVDGPKGLFIPPVANAPFSATVSLSIGGMRSAPGSSSSYVARDSAGRTYIERSSIIYSGGISTCNNAEFSCNDSGQSEPKQETLERIYIDPVQHTYYDCTVKDHLCHALAYDMATGQPSQNLPSSAITKQPLGQRKIDGLEAVGSRSTIAPYRETDETWYSNELKIDLLTKRTIGDKTQSLQVKSLKRSEPDPKLFMLPVKYKTTSAPLPAEQIDPIVQAALDHIRPHK